MTGRTDEAYATIIEWAGAFNAGEIEKVVSTYTSDALVLGTVSPALASTPDDIRSYFKSALAARFSVTLGDYSPVALGDDVVAFAGFYDFSFPGQNGQPVVIPARFSFVVAKRDGRWQIAHHHSSPKPKPV